MEHGARLAEVGFNLLLNARDPGILQVVSECGSAAGHTLTFFVLLYPAEAVAYVLVSALGRDRE